MNKALKILLLLLLWTAVVLALIAALIQTQPAKELLKKQAVAQIAPIFAQKVSIGRLRGNFFTHLIIEEVTVTDQTDTVIAIPRLDISYYLPALLHKTAVVRSLSVDDIVLRLVQRADSTWNVQNLLVPTETESPSDSSPSQSAWRFQVQQVTLNRARIDILPLQPLPRGVPSRIDLNARVQAAGGPGSLAVDLHRLHIEPLSAESVFDSLTTNLALQRDTLVVHALDLYSGRSHVEARGWLDLRRLSAFSLQVDGSALDLNDPIWQSPFAQTGAIDIHLQLMSDGEDGQGELQLRHQKEVLQLRGDFAHLNERQRFGIAGHFRQIDLAVWLNNEQWRSDIDGTFSLKASRSPSNSWDLQTIIDLDSSQVASLKVSDTKAQASARLGTRLQHLKANATIESKAFSASLAGSLTGEKYEAAIRFADLNLAVLTGDSSWQSDLQGRGKIHGQGMPNHSPLFDADLRLAPGSIAGVQMDTLVCRAIADRISLQLPEFLLQSEMLSANASGWIGLDKEGEIDFEVRPGDLSKLTFLPENADFDLEGQVGGTVSGRLDSLYLQAQVELFDYSWQQWKGESLRGPITASWIAGEPKAEIDWFASGLHQGATKLPQVRMAITAEMDSAAYELHLEHNDTLQLSMQGGVRWTPHQSLTIAALQADLLGSKWHSVEPIYLTHIDSLWTLQGLYFLSESQSILVEGSFLPDRHLDLSLHLLDLSLQPVQQLFPEWPLLAGRAKLHGRIVGPLIAPRVQIDFAFDNLTLQQTELGLIAGQATADSGRLAAEVNWKAPDYFLNLTGQLPATFDLTSEPVIDWRRDRPLQATLVAENVDLSVLRHLSEDLTQVRGRLNSGLQISGNWNEAKMAGDLFLQNGAVKVPIAGLDYRDILLKMTATDRAVILDTAYIASSDGRMRLKGNLAYAASFDTLLFKEIGLQAFAENFLAVQNRMMTLRVDGEVGVSGTLQKPLLQGNLSIPKSQFNLQPTANGPETKQPALLANYNRPDSAYEKPSRSGDWLQELRGSVQVKIPRNTWIRSSDLNMEISGDVAVVKSATGFELFGTIETLRGAYELYGKRFVLQKGKLEFLGGQEINPQVDIEALYSFRDSDRAKRQMALQLSGSLDKPDFSFLLDGIAVEEKDAFAYLLFGRGFEALTMGQRSELTEAQPGLLSTTTMTNVLAGQLANQLTERLRGELELDVIEFSGQDDWRQATLLVGKYLTNNLYLSYERTFALGYSTEVVPEKINLEYEIGRNWYLQASKGDEKTTGFDLIWKITRP